MNVSGAEAVVASASPWVGQGESACLIRPYVDLMTESELHLTMTSGPYFPPPFLNVNQNLKSLSQVSRLLQALSSPHTSTSVSQLKTSSPPP